MDIGFIKESARYVDMKSFLIMETLVGKEVQLQCAIMWEQTGNILILSYGKIEELVIFSKV